MTRIHNNLRGIGVEADNVCGIPKLALEMQAVFDDQRWLLSVQVSIKNNV